MANSIGVCPPGLPPSEQDLAFTPFMASVSQNHRNIKWFGSEGIIQIPLPCHGQGQLPLDQDIQSPIQPGLGALPGMEHPQLLWATSASVSPPSP